MHATNSITRPASPSRRWPLILIAAPAAVAIWSGWVRLGGMCGFGPVNLLPGIGSGFHLNTAITLPIGVEAYGAYALGVWLILGAIPDRARTFAKWSAIGALALGMGGQIISHLLTAANATVAPWPVTVLVSCMPVAVLGLAAALTHLLRAGETPQPGEDDNSVGNLPEQPEPVVATNREDAARKALAASLAGGNPFSQNYLVTNFRIDRPAASKLYGEFGLKRGSLAGLAEGGRGGEAAPLVPAASPNGSGGPHA